MNWSHRGEKIHINTPADFISFAHNNGLLSCKGKFMVIAGQWRPSAHGCSRSEADFVDYLLLSPNSCGFFFKTKRAAQFLADLEMKNRDTEKCFVVSRI
ncbi:MAG: hypothetical protein Q8R36_03970 [bacterium]|nr:hypothetical protein [bacterium]